MSESTAIQIAEAASRLDITLSAHAPYFINLNAREPEKIKASQQRLLQTARIALLCNIKSIVFHAAYYLGFLVQQERGEKPEQRAAIAADWANIRLAWQWAARMQDLEKLQCAAPVTGSSSMPIPGPKNREAKSYESASLRAVTMQTPNPSWRSRPVSGWSSRTVRSESTSTRYAPD